MPEFTIAVCVRLRQAARSVLHVGILDVVASGFFSSLAA
jgi:hypothetical protein